MTGVAACGHGLLVVVSADGRHADRMMAEILDFLERRVNAEGGAQLGAFETERIHDFENAGDTACHFTTFELLQ